MLPIGFGLSFQLPLVMLFLERIGAFNVASYLKKWAHRGAGDFCGRGDPYTGRSL